ncbi:MAG: transketolase, partial [Patescibacteria group bacterium]|nr:transketolase [Patescibacteria group bacterium]
MTNAKHQKMRDVFAEEIWQQMKHNSNIWVITGDLGFGTWDKVRDTYPDRFINTGAAEQSIIGIGTGLALMG